MYVLRTVLKNQVQIPINLQGSGKQWEGQAFKQHGCL